jgi:class 3 adenylate cyclase
LAEHRAIICKGCWQKMHVPVPLRGPFSIPFRIVGIKPSRMNPNICTICETMFTRIMPSRTIGIDATILFADLRGYTTMSQSLTPEAMSGVLDAFYDECAGGIWAHDGLLNKTIGDAVMAVFNFPIQQSDHARQAVLAARDIQARCQARRDALAESLGLADAAFGVGIGIHTGNLSFGEFGHNHRDLTAIGDVVNIAARAQGVAAAGEILVSAAVHDAARDTMGNGAARDYRLKGIEQPVALYAA